MTQNRPYSLAFRKEGVFLSIVHSAMQGSQMTIRGELTRYFEYKQLRGWDSAALDRLLADARLEEVALAPPQSEVLIDESASVQITRDCMSVTMTFLPPDGGEHMTYQAMIDILTEAKVVYGIDEETLRYQVANKQKEYGAPVLVVHGLSPIRGRDAWIEYHFETEHNRAPRMLPDGSVDHLTLDLYALAHKGDILATLHPAQEGTSGTDVLGNTTAAMSGKSMKLPTGKRTEIDESGLHLVSTTEGRIDYNGKKISVVHVLDVRGDVGPETGHIDFLGDVNVHGNVLAHYNISATGSVDVIGIIEACTIHADGNVVIRQGVKGKSNCKISAGGDITAKFIENATVFAGGIIRADVILHSETSSNDSIIVAGRKGTLAGGTARAVREVAANSIGAGGTTATTIEVGVTPTVRDRLSKSESSLRSLESAIQTNRANLDHLLLQARRGQLTSKQDERKEFLLSHLERLDAKLEARRHEITTLRELVAIGHGGKVHIRETIRGGTLITIGSRVTKIPHAFEYATFLRRDADIEMINYSFDGR